MDLRIRRANSVRVSDTLLYGDPQGPGLLAAVLNDGIALLPAAREVIIGVRLTGHKTPLFLQPSDPRWRLHQICMPLQTCQSSAQICWRPPTCVVAAVGTAGICRDKLIQTRCESHSKAPRSEPDVGPALPPDKQATLAQRLVRFSFQQ